jgi:8-oxo-dGTP pyrophosphatase MutT (NUDIX family)
VLLIDGRDRLLLFRGVNVSPTVPVVWITPGGGLQAGETHEQAALRELWEETGVVAPLGPCVWHRRHRFRFRDRWYDQRERFYVARVEAAAIAYDNLEAGERAFITEHRWWSLAGIAAANDPFAPRRLALLLPPVLAGDYPTEPIIIGT